MTKKPSVLVPLAHGVEEMEAVIIIDILRRAGWDVVAAALVPGVVEASRRVKLSGDVLLSDVLDQDFDCVVIPGGLGGVENLRQCPVLIAFLQKQMKTAWVAAICAGPLVLQDAGLLCGRTYTSHPSVSDQLTEGTRLDDAVVVDGRLMTSQGPGTALKFALNIIEYLESQESALNVSGPLCLFD